MGREEFRLLHYAGEVNYNVNGMYACCCKPAECDLYFFGVCCGSFGIEVKHVKLISTSKYQHCLIWQSFKSKQALASV